MSKTDSKRVNSKKGEIYINTCQFSSDMFPLQSHPQSWIRCPDAYAYTWLQDKYNDLKAFSYIDRLKLAYSTGYCPQYRCQLNDVSPISSRKDESCPEGQCYTRVEYGSPSFGACCYTNGSFVSNYLIGYSNKSQMTPKPIYSHSRVILNVQSTNKTIHENNYVNNTKNSSSCKDNGSVCSSSGSDSVINNDISSEDISSSKRKPLSSNTIVKCADPLHTKCQDTSPEAFINANEIYPGIIATQCPLSYHTPGDHADTTQDALRMILQKRVSLWIQIAPYVPINLPSLASSSSFLSYYQEHLQKSKCPIFPLDYFEFPHQYSISSFNGQVLTIQNLSYHSISSSNDIGQSNSDNLSIRSLLLDDVKVLDMTYTVAYKHEENIIQNCDTSEIASTPDSTVASATQLIQHLWYRGWEDYSIPSHSDDATVIQFVHTAARAIRQGETVVISCGSGRGRSGTLIAMIIAHLHNITSLRPLVDQIVQMRSSRDGLVELPSQIRYIARIMNVHSDTRVCNYICQLQKSCSYIIDELFVYYTGYIWLITILICLNILLVVYIMFGFSTYRYRK